MQRRTELGYPTWPTAIRPALPRHIFSGTTRQPLRGAVMAPLAEWQCDLATNMLTWSSGVYALFGLSPGTPLIREEIVEMYGETSRVELDRLRANAIAAGESFTFEARICRRNGEWRRMRVTADIVLANGRPTHLYGSKQDITDEAC